VSGRLKIWLTAFIATSAVVVLCYLYVDRPVAFFAHANTVPNRRYFDMLTRISEYLFVAAAVAFVVFGLRTLVTARWHKWQAALLLCGITLAVAETIKDELKFAFGRTWPETWVNNNPSPDRQRHLRLQPVPWRGGVQFVSVGPHHGGLRCRGGAVGRLSEASAVMGADGHRGRGRPHRRRLPFRQRHRRRRLPRRLDGMAGRHAMGRGKAAQDASRPARRRQRLIGGEGQQE
jgi:hypothetical protein